MSNLNWFYMQRWAYNRKMREEKERKEAEAKAKAKENQSKN
tara:strand:+ start:997 stop:1119 length:123 start_codon:yes stop_codon:yes gene_type:complete